MNTLPELSCTSPGEWVLRGAVGFADAEYLSQALDLEVGSSCRVDLSEVAGSAPLLLVLLAWCRQAQANNLELVFTRANDSLLRLVALSDLEALLPFEQNS